MSNTDSAYGLRAIRHLTGGEVRFSPYTITSGYAANIYEGDPVMLVSAGTLQIAPGGTANAIGVFAGCEYVDAAGLQKFSKFWPAGTTATNIVAFVYDDPNIVYSVQADATGVQLADVGAMADWLVVAGAPQLGISRTVLNATAYLGPNLHNLRIIRLVNDPSNSPGPFAKVEVLFAQHGFNANTGV